MSSTPKAAKKSAPKIGRLLGPGAERPTSETLLVAVADQETTPTAFQALYLSDAEARALARGVIETGEAA